MNEPFVSKCRCGSYVSFFMRISKIVDMFSEFSEEFVDYIVMCPSCQRSTPWIGKSDGGLSSAIKIWNVINLDVANGAR